MLSMIGYGHGIKGRIIGRLGFGMVDMGGRLMISDWRNVEKASRLLYGISRVRAAH